MKYLIIGASSGLGRELANIFAQKKNDLIIVSRDKRDLDALKSDLEIKYHVNVETIELDFSSLEEINEKLLSKNQILENLQGALFPVGMMFDEDNLSMNSEKIQKLVFSNFISIAHTINTLSKYLRKKNNSSLIGFGSVSGFLGRKINVSYAGAKRGLESFFESLAFDKSFKSINIQFYTLGYLDTNLSFGKDLKLPKGSIKKLSKLVYNNKNQNFKKIYYPAYWQIIYLIIKAIPISILRKFAEALNK